MSSFVTAMTYLRREWRSVLGGRPIRNPVESLPPPCFIVGSGRCGSTLLRAMLTISPDMHIPPETYGLNGLITEYRLLNRLPWSFIVRNTLSRIEYHKHFDVFEVSLRDLFLELNTLPPRQRSLATLINRLYMYHASVHKPTATRWGDKTPANSFHLDSLLGVFPAMKVIHMIRDGRDVVRSFTEIKGIGYLDKAMEHWLGAVRTVRAFSAKWPNQCLEVRYEELVAAPRQEMGRICHFLELTFEKEMLRHSEVGEADAEIRARSYHKNVMKPVFVSSIGRWRTAFDSATIRIVNRRLGPLLDELNYSS